MDSGDRIASPDYTHQEARIARARVVAEIAVGLMLDAMAVYWDDETMIFIHRYSGSAAQIAKAAVTVITKSSR